MNRVCLKVVWIVLLVAMGTALLGPPAQAGPQLVCWPFDIGGAKSLPWGNGWHEVMPDYDRSRLSADTLALLSPDASILLHMETLRRAAIYAAKDPRAAKELFSQLEKRAGAANSSAKPDPLALFDEGYFLEAYQQALWVEHSTLQLGTNVKGYEIIQRALSLRGSDAQMEFAAALVASAAGQGAAANQHLARSAAGATDDSLLSKNLVTHCHIFQVRAATLGELRSRLVLAKND